VIVSALLVWNTSVPTRTPLLVAPFVLAGTLLFFTVLLRVGLLAHMTATMVINVLRPAPLTLQPSAWYAPSGWVVIAFVMALAIYGFRVSLGGRKLLQSEVL
jgi:hypothetical protein